MIYLYLKNKQFKFELKKLLYNKYLFLINILKFDMHSHYFFKLNYACMLHKNLCTFNENSFDICYLFFCYIATISTQYNTDYNTIF